MSKKFSGNNALGDWADQLRRVQRIELPAFYSSILVIVGEEAAEDARERLIGRITPFQGVGPFPAWDPLQPATIERKEHEGLGKGGDPRSMLFATGAMHDSVGYTVNKKNHQVKIGSDIEYAAVHEYGSDTVPPRPFLGPALFRTVEKNYPKMENAFTRVLNSQKPF